MQAYETTCFPVTKQSVCFHYIFLIQATVGKGMATVLHVIVHIVLQKRFPLLPSASCLTCNGIE